MLDALRDTAVELAEAAYALGGCAFPSASTKLYDELPALPALCVGPVAMVPGSASVGRGRGTGGATGGGRVSLRADVSVLVFSPINATGAEGTDLDPEFGGPDGADTVAERLLASFIRAGFDLQRFTQSEGDSGVSPVYVTQAVFRRSLEMTFDALP